MVSLPSAFCPLKMSHLPYNSVFFIRLFHVQAAETDQRHHRLLALALHADVREPLLHQKVSELNNARPGLCHRSFQLLPQRLSGPTTLLMCVLFSSFNGFVLNLPCLSARIMM